MIFVIFLRLSFCYLAAFASVYFVSVACVSLTDLNFDYVDIRDWDAQFRSIWFMISFAIGSIFAVNPDNFS